MEDFGLHWLWVEDLIEDMRQFLLNLLAGLVIPVAGARYPGQA